jgi:tetratricopeptide (TPR) repeat protein
MQSLHPTTALLLTLIYAGVVVAGCRSPAAAPTSSSAGAASAGASSPAASSPAAAPTDTVPSATAVHNLSARIHLLEAQLGGLGQSATRDVQDRRELLIGLLMTRAQFLGQLSDYDRALELAEAVGRDGPDDPAALVTRARVRERLHLFADALTDLEAAAARGAPETSIETLRAAIFSAIGREDEAARLLARHNAAYPDVYSLGAEAIATARAGDMARADALFSEARAAYRDVSPFPPAWLDFQQGRVWHDRGDLARARPFYEAARVRVPEYAAATAHLAEVEATAGPEGHARAIALLRAVVATSDDPEYSGDLSQFLASDGREPQEAARLRAVAELGYDRLLALHREAFLDHAARFWLGPGGDPQRAAGLAEENAALRPTSEARALLASARAASAQVSAARAP